MNLDALLARTEGNRLVVGAVVDGNDPPIVLFAHSSDHFETLGDQVVFVEFRGPTGTAFMTLKDLEIALAIVKAGLALQAEAKA